MSNIWFTSDTHFGHKNICRGESQWNDKSRCRDFATVHEMNKYMTEQINRCVDVNDTLYHLGDFAFGGAKQVHEYINHINCKNIILILGNHDMRFKKLYTSRFKNVHNLKQSSVMIVAPDNVPVIMYHYPHKERHNTHAIYIHGHTHCYNGRIHDGQIDISVEGNDYKPYSLNEIIELAKETK